MKISLIGLGHMGFPMAENLLKAGYELTVFNRTLEKAAPLVAQGARLARTPLEAAKESDIVFTMLSDDAAVEQVVMGQDGIMNGMPEKGIHISASTISVETSRKLAAAHEERSQFLLSATVLGRPDAAKTAQLRIIMAGPEEARERVLPIMETLGQETFVIGDRSEGGNVVKIGVNFLIASMLEALSEAQLMVEKYDVEPNEFMKVVNSLFQSPVYRNYGAMMADGRFEPGFKMKLGLKDVNLAIKAAENVNSPIPLGRLIHENFGYGIERGYGELDWTALIRCLH